MHTILLLLGIVIGVIIGWCLCALIVNSRQADEQMDEAMNRYQYPKES